MEKYLQNQIIAKKSKREFKIWQSKLLVIIYWLILLLLPIRLFAAVEIGLQLQPIIEVNECGSSVGSGSFDLSIHRSRISIDYDQKNIPFTLLAKISVDLSEYYAEDILKNGWIGFKTDNEFISTKWRVGKFKVPFYQELITSSKKLWNIDRSFTAEYLKNQLDIGGHQYGVGLHFSFNDILVCDAGLYKYSENNAVGFDIADIFSLPVTSIQLNILERFYLRYMFIAPLASMSFISGIDYDMRLYLHTVSLNAKFTDWYSFSAEYFSGIDTANTRDVQKIIIDYSENIAYSLYTLHRFSIPIMNEKKIHLVTGFEFLNGLNNIAGIWSDRSFYFGLSQNIELSLKKDLALQLILSEKFDDTFSATHNKRIAMQCSWNTKLKIANIIKKHHN